MNNLITLNVEKTQKLNNELMGNPNSGNVNVNSASSNVGAPVAKVETT